MKELFKSILSDTDGSGSSKRVVVLWIAIPIWTFIHWAVFLKGGGNDELKSTLIMYDFFTMIGGLGIILSEKFAPKKEETPTDKTKTP